MAHSYVETRGRSVLMRDGHIELVVYAILAAYGRQNHADLTVNGEDLLKYWRTAISDEWGVGCINLRIDHFLVSDEDRMSFLSFATKARDLVLGAGEFVESKRLKELIGDESIPFDERISTAVFGQAFDQFFSVFK